MNLSQALHSFFADNKLVFALILVAVDFVLGTGAAFKSGKFRLSYIADFARNDLLEKLAPWGVLYLAAKYAPNAGVGPIDFGAAAMSIYVLIVAAWSGSIFSSLAELGLPIKAPSFSGGENDAPPKS